MTLCGQLPINYNKIQVKKCNLRNKIIQQEIVISNFQLKTNSPDNKKKVFHHKRIPIIKRYNDRILGNRKYVGQSENFYREIPTKNTIEIDRPSSLTPQVVIMKAPGSLPFLETKKHFAISKNPHRIVEIQVNKMG